jgi:hypothetical protein
MYGPQIVARSISAAAIADRYGNKWQYHSRSDRHSKVACWSMLFDLVQHSRVLADHVRKKEVVFGINHEMVDFEQGRKKNLDLVICTPGTASGKRKPKTLVTLASDFGVLLSPAERKVLDALPEFVEGPVGAVRLALEAKACMTAHVKALPRLYDELNSSHLTVHGATDIGIAAGFVMVNNATEFMSADMNKHDLSKTPPRVTKHKQPDDSKRAIQKVLEIPRRTTMGTTGFDGLALVVVDMRNDGSPVKVITTPPAPAANEVLQYDSMIARVAQLYDFRFGRA